MDDSTTGSIIIGVVGAITGALTTLFIKVKRENNKQDLAENEQAFALYKSLVETLGASVNKLELRIIEIEKQNLICEKENVRLKALIELLQAKVESLESQLKKT